MMQCLFSCLPCHAVSAEIPDSILSVLTSVKNSFSRSRFCCLRETQDPPGSTLLLWEWGEVWQSEEVAQHPGSHTYYHSALNIVIIITQPQQLNFGSTSKKTFRLYLIYFDIYLLTGWEYVDGDVRWQQNIMESCNSRSGHKCPIKM